jgi:tRNA(Ile)-lysidine synthase
MASQINHRKSFDLNSSKKIKYRFCTCYPQQEGFVPAMIKMLGKVPSRVAISVSGGPDSMAALDFLYMGGKREVFALHFNHNTDHAYDAEKFVRAYCKKKNIPLAVGGISREKRADESQEEYWRNERYSFFNDWANGRSVPIITCHHLDDVVETWIFSSLHGRPSIIPYKRDSFIRPFLISRKDDLLSWCKNKSVPFIIDPSNMETSHMRNYIRKNLMLHALHVNPGLFKVVKKKVIKAFENSVDFF